MKTLLNFFIFFSFCFLSYAQNIKNFETQKNKDTSIFELVDGTRITKSQLDSIFQKAWDNSFGKMSKEDEKLLFSNSNIIIETKPIKKED